MDGCEKILDPLTTRLLEGRKRHPSYPIKEARLRSRWLPKPGFLLWPIVSEISALFSGHIYLCPTTTTPLCPTGTETRNNGKTSMSGWGTPETPGLQGETVDQGRAAKDSAGVPNTLSSPSLAASISLQGFGFEYRKQTHTKKICKWGRSWEPSKWRLNFC